MTRAVSRYSVWAFQSMASEFIRAVVLSSGSTYIQRTFKGAVPSEVRLIVVDL